MQRHEAVAEISQPTEEELQLLVESARTRIETIDGADFLDGHPLPPDNDELWDNTPMTVRITDMRKIDWGLMREDPDTAFKDVQSTVVVPPSITNRKIRDSNIRSLAQGFPPIFGHVRNDVHFEEQGATPRIGILGRFLEKLSRS